MYNFLSLFLAHQLLKSDVVCTWLCNVDCFSLDPWLLFMGALDFEVGGGILRRTSNKFVHVYLFFGWFGLDL